MTKLVAFDWNSTLLADTTITLYAVNEVLSSLGKCPIDIHQFRRTTTMPVDGFYLNNGLTQEEIIENEQKISEIFHTEYEVLAKRCRTRRGTRETLRWLGSNSIESILVSNHTVEGILLQLERLNLRNYFSEIFANSCKNKAIKERTKLSKLKDHMINRGYDPQEVFIVGDASEEIEIGKELGIGTIAITGGVYSASRLRASSPDHLITNLSLIINIIQSNS